MKKIIILLIIMVASSMYELCYAFESKIISIKNRVNTSERIIYDGEIIKIICQDGKRFKGSLEILNDTIIKLNHDTINISNIILITRNPRFTSSTGQLLLGFGLIPSIIGVAGLISVRGESGDAALGIFPALFFAGIGFIFDITGLSLCLISKDFTKEEWMFKIDKTNKRKFELDNT
jgi:hypothetical protein